MDGIKNNIIGHLHWEDNSGQYKNQGGTKSIENSHDEFHIYSLVWDSSKISILLDDETFFYYVKHIQQPL